MVTKSINKRAVPNSLPFYHEKTKDYGLIEQVVSHLPEGFPVSVIEVLQGATLENVINDAVYEFGEFGSLAGYLDIIGQFEDPQRKYSYINASEMNVLTAKSAGEYMATVPELAMANKISSIANTVLPYIGPSGAILGNSIGQSANTFSNWVKSNDAILPNSIRQQSRDDFYWDVALAAFDVASFGAGKAISATGKAMSAGMRALNAVNRSIINTAASGIFTKGLELAHGLDLERVIFRSRSNTGLGNASDALFAPIRNTRLYAVPHGRRVVPNTSTSQFVKNPQFFKAETSWKASGKGTGNEYKVFQQEIDWSLEVKGVSNLERAKGGGAPYIMKDGKPQQIQLHHSRQNAQGPLFELSRKTHLQTKMGQGREAIHPYGNKQNPDFPVDRTLFKKEIPQYWMDRARDAQR